MKHLYCAGPLLRGLGLRLLIMILIVAAASPGEGFKAYSSGDYTLLFKVDDAKDDVEIVSLKAPSSIVSTLSNIVDVESVSASLDGQNLRLFIVVAESGLDLSLDSVELAVNLQASMLAGGSVAEIALEIDGDTGFINVRGAWGAYYANVGIKATGPIVVSAPLPPDALETLSGGVELLNLYLSLEAIYSGDGKAVARDEVSFSSKEPHNPGLIAYSLPGEAGGISVSIIELKGYVDEEVDGIELVIESSAIVSGDPHHVGVLIEAVGPLLGGVAGWPFNLAKTPYGSSIDGDGLDNKFYYNRVYPGGSVEASLSCEGYPMVCVFKYRSIKIGNGVGVVGDPYFMDPILLLNFEETHISFIASVDYSESVIAGSTKSVKIKLKPPADTAGRSEEAYGDEAIEPSQVGQEKSEAELGSASQPQSGYQHNYIQSQDRARVNSGFEAGDRAILLALAVAAAVLVMLVIVRSELRASRRSRRSWIERMELGRGAEGR